MGVSVWSCHWHPIANVHCCAEHFHPNGFRHAQMVEYGVLGTGEYSNCLFCYTIRHMVVWDWGAAWSVVLADVVHLAHW